MIPKHAMDLFIEKSQVEICVLRKIKVHGSMQSSVYRPTVYDVPSARTISDPFYNLITIMQFAA